MNEIMNILKAHGPIAASEVAQMVGRSIEDTYHKLVMLHDMGATRIVGATSRGNGKWDAA